MSCAYRTPTIRPRISATSRRRSNGILSAGSGRIPISSCGQTAAGLEALYKPHLPLTAPQPHSLIEDKDSGERHWEHVNRPQRQVSDWPGGATSGLSVSRCDLRYRSELLEHRGVVPVDPTRSAPGQGSAVLSPARRECRQRVRRLCLGAESRAGYFRRAV